MGNNPMNVEPQRTQQRHGVRSANLSITHNFLSKLKPEMDVGESREAAPKNSIARWSVVFTTEVAAEFGERMQVVGHVFRRGLRWVAGQLMKDR